MGDIMTNPGVVAEPLRHSATDPRLAEARYDEARLAELTTKTYLVGGRKTELYTIGQLATMLGRSPVTLRAWERKGHIPPTPLRRNFEGTRGGRRLYTKAQVLGIVHAARITGVFLMYTAPRIPKEFREECDKYFTAPAKAA
ncbi:MerR family transcriptional regulator [Streptosporangium sp. NPDC023825]|uniref:MerR family transcriptional regulator n=1 Tax=Streptosporangium sp. NPDC023825 TaxID=3154909 RepID=UPI00342FF4F5